MKKQTELTPINGHKNGNNLALKRKLSTSGTIAVRTGLIDDQAVGAFLAALIVDLESDAVSPKIAAHQISAISRMQSNISMRYRFGSNEGGIKRLRYYNPRKAKVIAAEK